jgi:hypothetical protein
MNPLFTAESRRVSMAQLAEERGRDIADLWKFQSRFQRLLERTGGLGDKCSFHEGLTLREEYEKLLVRADQIGAATQQESLRQCYEG